MYQPPHFRETRIEVLHALIRAHPLGLVVSNGADGPVANPLPFLLVEEPSGPGRLRAHFSRANAQWKAIAADPATPVLVVFQGPQAYVTPSWYETKSETGKVVPTWNYVIAQARGRATIAEDADWLRGQVEALTGVHENGRAQPWTVDDAPADFITAQLRGIVGIEIEIAAIEGKWKVSQNRTVSDRIGVAGGYEEAARPDMAGLVRAFGPEPG